ncbi:hypothetical protein [Mycolicibacterium sp.]|uniref:hypothetical protein n=1 Tax=Mycolicibacterium sp. TaxID=2320850 RepID=UPI003D0E3A6A
MYPARPPAWIARESEILAARLILIYLDSDEDARTMYMWALQDETGIDWVAFESARRSAMLAAHAWLGREETARRMLLARLGELMPA